MIRANDFMPTQREDDLLMRLKQCVGSLENVSKQHKKTPSLRVTEITKSKQLFLHDTHNQNEYESRPSYRQSFGDKQNQTEKKYYVRQQDYKKFSNEKQNIDIVKKTKNYLQSNRQNCWYSQPDRKRFIPLAEVQHISNIKRQLFTKEVSSSTKKRIAERQFLINGENENYARIKLPERQQKQRNAQYNEEQFLERLSLRKKSYLDQSNPRKQAKNENINCIQNKGYDQSDKKALSLKKQRASNAESIKKIHLLNEQKQRAQILIPNLPKYENYSKITIQNLVKDQDLRKAQKMQKLKKITNMNEEINKKIRRIVDTFENYLTEREI